MKIKTLFLALVACAGLLSSCGKSDKENKQSKASRPSAGHQSNSDDEWDIKDIKKVQKQADRGNSAAQFAIAMWYYQGKEGLPVDKPKAVAYMMLAAENEDPNPDAQCNLGLFYLYGEIVQKDNVKAVKWFCEAAARGNAIAQYWLGVGYYNGDGGLTRDVNEATRWFRKSAEQGYYNAQMALQEMGQNVNAPQPAQQRVTQPVAQPWTQPAHQLTPQRPKISGICTAMCYSGRCKICDGKGRILIGSTSVVNPEQNCMGCCGTGKCKYCNGTGKSEY